MGSLACHGYLIDELWLISSSECFVNKTTTQQPTKKTTSDEHDEQPASAPTATTTTGGLPADVAADSSGWTAEISYEHYGADGSLLDDGGGGGGYGRSIPIRPSNRRRNINEILRQEPSHLGSPIVLAKLEEPVRFR